MITCVCLAKDSKFRHWLCLFSELFAQNYSKLVVLALDSQHGISSTSSYRSSMVVRVSVLSSFQCCDLMVGQWEGHPLTSFDRLLKCGKIRKMVQDFWREFLVCICRWIVYVIDETDADTSLWPVTAALSDCSSILIVVLCPWHTLQKLAPENRRRFLAPVFHASCKISGTRNRHGRIKISQTFYLAIRPTHVK